MDAQMLLAVVESEDGRVAVGLADRQVPAGGETEILLEATGRETTWHVEAATVTLRVPFGDSESVKLVSETLIADETVDPEPTAERTATLSVPAWAPRPIGGIDVIVETELTTDHGATTGRNHLNVSNEAMEAAFETVRELGYVPRGFELAPTDADGEPPYKQLFHLAPPGSDADAEPTTTLVCRPTVDQLEVAVDEHDDTGVETDGQA